MDRYKFGHRFGRVVITGLGQFTDRQLLTGVCDCGTVRDDYRLWCLKRGLVRSCGCLSKELSAKRRTTHGLSKTPEHRVWGLMRDRCNNPKNKHYRHYGGRGITVCEEWNSFEKFLADMGPRPGDGYSIERRNNDRGYNKDNCTWATAYEQTRNRRANVTVEVEGQTLCISDACRTAGVPVQTLYSRCKRHGMTIQEGVSAGLLNYADPRKKSVLVEGEKINISEVCRKAGVHPTTFKSRCKKWQMTFQEGVNAGLLRSASPT